MNSRKNPFVSGYGNELFARIMPTQAFFAGLGNFCYRGKAQTPCQGRHYALRAVVIGHTRKWNLGQVWTLHPRGEFSVGGRGSARYESAGFQEAKKKIAEAEGFLDYGQM